MADTQPLAPTDAEILEAVKHLGAAMLSPIEVARTVLAKWGAQPVPAGYALVPVEPVTEDMHIAAVKVLQRASGLDGLPQRMLAAMLAAAPQPPRCNQSPAFFTVFAKCEGDELPLAQYGASSENGVLERVMDAARREGYTGHPQDRMTELRWRIGPVYAAPQPVVRKPLTDEQIQNLLGFGDPTEQEKHLIRLGRDAAHGITTTGRKDAP